MRTASDAAGIELRQTVRDMQGDTGPEDFESPVYISYPTTLGTMLTEKPPNHQAALVRCYPPLQSPWALSRLYDENGFQ